MRRSGNDTDDYGDKDDVVRMCENDRGRDVLGRIA